MVVAPRASVLFLAFSIAAGSQAQSSLEEAKRAYFEGRFEASLRSLEALLGTLSDPTELRDAAFFAGLDQLALGDQQRGRSYFESAVRHDPSFEPAEDLFNPKLIALFRDVRSSLVGRLLVESTPPGAEVFIGGQMVGKTPYQGASLSGEQLVRVQLAGHTTEERRVRVRAGDDTNLMVELRSAESASSPSSTSSPSSSSSQSSPPPSGGGGVSGKTIGILAGAGGGAAAALALASGGGNSGSSTTTPTPSVSRAAYSVSITPSTVSAQPSSDPGFDWLIRFTVNLMESNGLGGNVDFVNVTLRDAVTGSTTSAVNFGAHDVISDAGTNRIEAKSQLQIPIGIVYNFPRGNSTGSLSVDMQVTDDRGNVQRLSANANIR